MAFFIKEDRIMKRSKHGTVIKITCLLIAVMTILLFVNTYSQACTMAVVSAERSSTGRPFIWKNRDNSGSYRQEVKYFEAVVPEVGGSIRLMGEGFAPELNPLQNIPGFDGLIPANSSFCSAGANESGFAIANSTVYETFERELDNQNTTLMAAALEQCITVSDFEVLVKNWSNEVISGNFAVIDAHGGAVLYEIWSNGGKSDPDDLYINTFDANAVSEGFVTRTNSHEWISHDYDTAREFRSYQMLDELSDDNNLNYRTVIQQIAKDVCGGDCTTYDDHGDGNYWESHEGPCEETLSSPTARLTRYCISRYQTTASFVVDGVPPGEDTSLLTCWISLGEPAFGVSTPYFVSAQGTSEYAYFDNNLLNPEDYWDGVSPASDDKSGSFLNSAFDKFNNDYLYSDNGLPWIQWDGIYQYPVLPPVSLWPPAMDRTIDYNNLLTAKKWILPLETNIIDRTEAFMTYLRNNPDQISRDILHQFSHYCAAYVYGNYQQESATSVPWTYIWENNPPSIISTGPLENETDIQRDTVITAEFSEVIDETTLNMDTFIVSTSEADIEGEITFDISTKTAIFTPVSELNTSTIYSVRITPDVKDCSANNLVEEKVWSFTTEGSGNYMYIEPDESDGCGCASSADASTLRGSKRPILPGLLSIFMLMLFPLSIIIAHRVFRRKKSTIR